VSRSYRGKKSILDEFSVFNVKKCCKAKLETLEVSQHMPLELATHKTILALEWWFFPVIHQMSLKRILPLIFTTTGT
jgi:hypothetical protein